MKKYIPKIPLVIIACISVVMCAHAQNVPQGVSYQAIARDAAGKVLDDQSINIKIALQEGADGTVLYEETHQLTTDAFGLFTLVIGQGSALTGAFDDIDWSGGVKFLQVAMDPKGGDNFIEMGTTQLLSVPYALYAEKSGDTAPPPTLHAGKGIAITNDSLTNTGDVDASDDLTITTEAEGDVRGKFADLKVVKLQGTKLGIPDSIGDGTVLKWDGEQWRPGTDSTIAPLWGNKDENIFYETGLVGIGTASPINLLHLHDSTNQESSIRFTTNSTAKDSTDGLWVGTDNQKAFIWNFENKNLELGTNNKIGITLNPAGDIEFGTEDDRKVIINRFGQVGIGTSSPTTLHHVHDPIEHSPLASYTHYTNVFTGTRRFDDGLSIGINQINASIVNNEAGDLTIVTGESGLVTGAERSGALKLGAGGISNRMIIMPDGKVGIGPGEPETELDVNGNLTLKKSGRGSFMRAFGRNGFENVWVGFSTNPFSENHGSIYVADGGGVPQAGAFVDNAGKGIIFGDEKNFRIPHPVLPGKEIWYCTIEGPEAAVYYRGTDTLVDGKATITFPEHFHLVANPNTMTILVTPRSASSKGLAVIKRNGNGFQVQELFEGKGNYKFDWEVKAVRKGHEDFQVIRDSAETHYENLIPFSIP